MRQQPILCRWREVTVFAFGDGEIHMALVPATDAYAKAAAHQFATDGEYLIEQAGVRNMRFHRKYYVLIQEYFDQMPEALAARWDDSEQLRLWVLVHKTKWYHEAEIDLAGGETIKASGAWVFQRGGKFIARYPQSQSVKAMGKADFEKSAEDVLEALAEMTGIPVSQMAKNAGRAA